MAGDAIALQDKEVAEEEAELWQRLAAAIEKSPTPKTVRASFNQTRTSLLLSEPVKSKGVFLSNGVVSRWSLGEPEGVEVRTDAEQMQIYYVSDNLLEVYPIPEQGLPMPNQRPDLQRLKKNFHLEMFESQDQHIRVRFKARGDMRKHIKSLALQFDSARGVLTRVTTFDPAGDTTQMSLEKIEIDEKITPDELKLNVPDDARVERPAESN